uniref:Uncharacterized protein n=1 Tax=Oncorhynchus tshawytscha TaxID=74940 RepID=A0AAZ3R706_ONCTS
MVTCKETSAVIIALHKKGFTGKEIAASKIAPKHLLDHQELQGERFNCYEEGFREPKKVQQAPGPSPKTDSVAGSGHHLYRACSGMAAGRCEYICTHSEVKTFGGWPGVKKGSKEAIRKKLVRRRQGERYHQSCVIPTVKHPETIHVWGCFSAKGVGSLTILPKNTAMNKEWYQHIPREQLLPTI